MPRNPATPLQRPEGDFIAGDPKRGEGWIALYVRTSDLPFVSPRPTLITQHNCLAQLGVPPERFKRDARNGKFASCLLGKLRTAIYEDAARYYSRQAHVRTRTFAKRGRVMTDGARSAAEEKAEEIRRELRLIRTTRSRSNG